MVTDLTRPCRWERERHRVVECSGTHRRCRGLYITEASFRSELAVPDTSTLVHMPVIDARRRTPGWHGEHRWPPVGSFWWPLTSERHHQSAVRSAQIG